MKFRELRPYQDPAEGVRKLLEIANATEAIQDGRIYVELINGQFLKEGGTPAEYGAALDYAVARAWLAGRCSRRVSHERRPPTEAALSVPARFVGPVLQQ